MFPEVIGVDLRCRHAGFIGPSQGPSSPTVAECVQTSTAEGQARETQSDTVVLESPAPMHKEFPYAIFHPEEHWCPQMPPRQVGEQSGRAEW